MKYREKNIGKDHSNHRVSKKEALISPFSPLASFLPSLLPSLPPPSVSPFFLLLVYPLFLPSLLASLPPFSYFILQIFCASDDVNVKDSVVITQKRFLPS